MSSHVLPVIDQRPEEARAAFGAFPTGVAALCAQVHGVPTGLVVTSLSVGVSFDPPLVVFSAQESSKTWKLLRSSPRIGVSVLSEQQRELCLSLASRTKDRFAGAHLTTTPEDAVLLEGASMNMECEIVSETTMGDHTLVALRVLALERHPDVPPLVYRDRSFFGLGPLTSS